VLSTLPKRFCANESCAIIEMLIVLKRITEKKSLIIVAFKTPKDRSVKSNFLQRRKKTIQPNSNSKPPNSNSFLPKSVLWIADKHEDVFYTK